MFPAYVYINGEFLPEEKAGMPVKDLALLRGFGVFDFFRLHHGHARHFDAHWHRLLASAEAMHLSMPLDKADLQGIIEKLYSYMPYAAAGIRVTLTGGSSPNGYTPARQPNVLITLQAIEPFPDALPTQDYGLMSYPYTRPLCGVKTIDYSMGIWLQPRLHAAGFQEVLYHQHGKVSECPRANLFMVHASGKLLTPPARLVLGGITRSRVLKAAQHILPTQEKMISLTDLYEAAEVFITSTTRGVQPVLRVDHAAIGSGKPGPVATQLYDMLCREQPF